MASNSDDIDDNSWLYSIIDQWSCPMCTSHNPVTNYPHCNVCQQINPLSLEDFLNVDQSKSVWSCPRCTLNNKINNERCKICNTPKPASNHDEKVLINSTATSSNTYMSLNVRDRRHRNECDAENIFQDIIKYCKKHKTHFVDDQFFPSSRSIGTKSFTNVSQWLRISNVAPLPKDDPKLSWTIFSSPQPSDIEQGALGNCWLVAALALVSERPRLLEHILLTKQVNHEGVYLVRICHNGLWKTIIVDDCFPCTKHKHLVFTQAKRRQLYAALIEKACAKLFGSYASLRSGNMLEGLQLLTGAPCDYIDLKPSHNTLEKDTIWARLLTAFESELLIGVSSGGNDVSAEEYNSVHIHKNHAFSILAAHTLAINSQRYVLVRDPHSRSKYTEDSMTEDILKQLRLINSADRSTGAFWISWSRFLRYFSSITVSTYNSNHFDVREQGQFTQSSTEDLITYRFYVPETSKINISLLYHRHDRTTHSSHTQSFVLCDADELESSGIVGKRESILICKRGGFTYWSDSLRPGFYVLIPFSTSFWNNNKKNRDFTVVIHSSVQLDLTIENKSPTLLSDCLISAIMKNYSKKEEKTKAAFYKTSKHSGSKIFIAENSSVTEFLRLDIDIKVAKNVRHSRFSHLPYDTHDCIPPRHRQIIFITDWTDENNETSYLNYSYSYKHSTRQTDSEPSINITKFDLHSPRAF